MLSRLLVLYLRKLLDITQLLHFELLALFIKFDVLLSDVDQLFLERTAFPLVLLRLRSLELFQVYRPRMLTIIEVIVWRVAWHHLLGIFARIYLRLYERKFVVGAN